MFKRTRNRRQPHWMAGNWDSDTLIIADLLGPQALNDVASRLAEQHGRTVIDACGSSISERIEEDADALLSAYRVIGKSVDAGADVKPAAEWLIDNYYILEEQIFRIYQDLPPSYYRKLPKLVEGPFAGHPRILAVIWTFVAHTHAQIDIDLLRSFLKVYQQKQPLTIGELWAVPITLRFMLIENFRRLADALVSAQIDREKADDLIGNVVAGKPFDRNRLAEASAPSHTFAVQLVHRLRGIDDTGHAILRWLEERLAAQGTTTDAVVSDVQHMEALSNVIARNLVTSLRAVTSVDWSAFFETVCPVDDVLNVHPSYEQMDLASRNLYRTAVEQLARGSGVGEVEIARRAMLAADSIRRVAEPGGKAEDNRRTDPGYYLVGDGRREFETGIGFRPTFTQHLTRSIATMGLSGYLTLIACVAVVLIVVAEGAFRGTGIGIFEGLMLAPPVAFLAFDLAGSLVNFFITKTVAARLIPALDLSPGVPDELRTLVVIPALITSVESVEELVEQLEMHYLANPRGALNFALLTDFLDADSERLPTDAVLLDHAAAAIEDLNKRHGDDGRFQLLHRRRVWSDGEERFMGWERKRGKLQELNRLLRGHTETTFERIVGKVPQGVRYVVTLDSDTRMPHDTVHRLVGKIAHPLVSPHVDADCQRVVAGHGILQPRVTPSLSSSDAYSPYKRVYSSPTGLDPYVFAVSDVYQDLFDEGTFTGKGIYEVDAFEAALAGRIPDNTILSHDLFEGTFARAGLVTDIEVIESYPSRYDVASGRSHRWVRGDWQLLPWILGRQVDGLAPAKRHLPGLGLWKMIDNLRRSLTAPIVVVATILALALLPLTAVNVWLGLIIVVFALPQLVPVLDTLAHRPKGTQLASHLRTVGSEAALALARTGLNLVFLTDQAWQMGDAIGRTLYRLAVSHKHRLEWVSAAQLEANARYAWIDQYRNMAGGLILGVVLLMAGAVGPSGNLLPALVLGLIIFGAPLVAWFVSRNAQPQLESELSGDEAKILTMIARRTWRYFETFVTEEHHHLPPDNFQETPHPIAAHRTSPTNIGLYLLSAVAARDLGWVGLTDTIAHLDATLTTLEGLERFRGHPYNWYNTYDCRVLEPRYISAVDNGNLAGHLITLANACRSWVEAPLPEHIMLKGFIVCLDLIEAEINALPPATRSRRGLIGELLTEIASLRQAAGSIAEGGTASIVGIMRLLVDSRSMTSKAEAFAQDKGLPPDTAISLWAYTARETLEAAMRDLTMDSAQRLAQRAHLQSLADRARAYAVAMDFSFLVDPDRLLLSIGYRTQEGLRDESCYDLLASEARLASFFAIAKGDLPAKHWFRMGRTVVAAAGSAALVSWSGSMFEYLMPSLIMKEPQGGILHQTNKLIVRRQISYGKELGVPWGISESALNSRDIEFTYQYSNFGVPGLGLKRGLAENSVIAPYATALASMFDAKAAVRNFARLKSEGGLGVYGYYEALDYTPTRVPEDKKVEVIQSYMAHHQGMSIVAISNVLLDGRMRDLFHSEPMIMATELLLQERAPRQVPSTHSRSEDVRTSGRVREQIIPVVRNITDINGSVPQVQLMSNGRYTVMLTAAGSGYSLWKGMAVTRWREDATLDNWGSYIYVRDLEGGETWSIGYQPIGRAGTGYEASFTEDRAEITREDGTIRTMTQFYVSPEDDGELRLLTLTNTGRRARDLDVTSYMELVLAKPMADLGHMVFSKLFVQTEFLEDHGALIAWRRQRSPGDAEMYVAHLLVVEGETVRGLDYETDRERFLGRGNDAGSAKAMRAEGLSRTTGTVLDPIFSLRQRVRIPSGGSVKCAFWTLAATSRDELIALIDRYRHPYVIERTAVLCWTHSQIHLYHLGIDAEEAALFQQLASHVIYATSVFRPPSRHIAQGLKPQSALWPLSISGDYPIILVRIDDSADLGLVRQMIRAHDYFRTRQLAVDVVILNDRASSYVQDLQIAIDEIARASRSQVTGADPAPGRLFLLRNDLLSNEARALLPAVARVTLVGRRGMLARQFALSRASMVQASPVALPPPTRAATLPLPTLLPTTASADAGRGELTFFNEYGGFSEDGCTYVIETSAGRLTPAPWVNVVANEQFGFQTSAEGSTFSWSVNSRENQITGWSNDPVTTRSSEVFYVTDEETGRILSPTALPVRNPVGTYICRHGQGYSIFTHTVGGLEMELTMLVAGEDPVRLARLRLKNRTSTQRSLRVTSFVELTMGPMREQSLGHVATEQDTETGALFARNAWSQQFGHRVTFAACNSTGTSFTTDRTEFLGRNGSPAWPQALRSRIPLSRAVGVHPDPCIVLQAPIVLAPQQETEIIFALGQTDTDTAARELIAKYRNVDFNVVHDAVKVAWDELLGAITVTTPEPSFDIFVNRWALYQALSCRMWGRTGFYQASGAYGFRDQLQDSMSLLHVRPGIARGHILKAASRQFVEGDVQHWWLPQSGAGVRTRITDDVVWLAYCTAHYVQVTGDATILDETVGFIEGQQLSPGEHDAFFHPGHAEEEATLFEHCRRALDHALQFGAHDLPLMGTGDWNDGMNRVGEKGLGESVWLAWFMVKTLGLFADIAAERDAGEAARRWRTAAEDLLKALDDGGWDGNWYRRGYFDDGTPLGSASRPECKIDAIAQSWSVISNTGGFGDSRTPVPVPARAKQAMAASENHLWRRHDKLALLFAPPFDATSMPDPGYIKAYPPGLRENGGQYTHGAIWSVFAFAQLGEGKKATDLFQMLNPINHSLDRAEADQYRVEPYVVAADIYSVAPHVGRGGWTWYTGSAGMMYRAATEAVLGIAKAGDTLILRPAIPDDWPAVDIRYRFGSAVYVIEIRRGLQQDAGDAGTISPGTPIQLVDDGAVHTIRILLQKVAVAAE